MENHLRIAVCDDLSTDRAHICEMAGKILRDIGISYEMMAFGNAQSLLAAIEGGQSFHILLLDVMLEDMSGLELAAALRRQHNKTEIIFISINRELAMLGYEVSAARYLAKPLSEEKLREALLYCHGLFQRRRDVLIPTEQGQHRCGLAEIAYVEAYDRGTRFFLESETIVSRMKFKDAEQLLDPFGFAVCHRSYLVNLSQVRLIRHYELELKDGRIVPIGKARYGEIRKRFLDIAAE